jgi:hypothetical protein
LILKSFTDLFFIAKENINDKKGNNSYALIALYKAFSINYLQEGECTG